MLTLKEIFLGVAPVTVLVAIAKDSQSISGSSYFCSWFQRTSVHQHRESRRGLVHASVNRNQLVTLWRQKEAEETGLEELGYEAHEPPSLVYTDKQQRDCLKQDGRLGQTPEAVLCPSQACCGIHVSTHSGAPTYSNTRHNKNKIKKKRILSLNPLNM